MDSVAVPEPGPASLRQADGWLQPDPEPEPDPEDTGATGGNSGEAYISTSSRMVETVEARPHHHPPDSEVPGCGVGWLARWRCCVNVPANAPPPLADAEVLPLAPDGKVQVDPPSQMAESDRVQGDGSRSVTGTISEGVPPA
eukprot:COSAG02_NODE_31781_length_527_cov_1.102804_1_plen_142_part_10